MPSRRHRVRFVRCLIADLIHVEVDGVSVGELQGAKGDMTIVDVDGRERWPTEGEKGRPRGFVDRAEARKWIQSHASELLRPALAERKRIAARRPGIVAPNKGDEARGLVEEARRKLDKFARGFDGGTYGSGDPICRGCHKTWLKHDTAPDGGHAMGCPVLAIDRALAAACGSASPGGRG